MANDPVKANDKRVAKRQRGLEQIFAAMPVRVDAIRDKRESDAIALRAFMLKRESSGKSSVVRYSEKGWMGDASDRAI